jgi:long-chain acyl-CoA synthetase
MPLHTLNDILLAVTERNHARVMLHRRAIEWIPISAQELYRHVAGVAGALCAWGIGKGDRVAILSENRPEWTTADFAAMALGAVIVPIYATLTAEQIGYILSDSGVRVIFVSTEQQLQKISAIQGRTPIEKIVVMDPVENAHATHMYQLMQAGNDSDLKGAARRICADDLATIIYTSGTTGTPKGVMLTHGNMASNLACSLSEFGISSGDISISFLPLSHVTARHVDFAMLYHGVTLAYVPFIDHLPQAMREVKPSVFVAVPRVYEKIHGQAEIKTKGALKRLVYKHALKVGRRHRSEILSGQEPRSLEWRIANRVVYSQIRAGMGGRARLFISGGAPLGRELAQWYADIGIRVHEGYGLTETSPVIAVNTPKAHKLGTVGRPLANVEVNIAADGEILVRGPSVFKEYWNKPDETVKAFADGWFKTGDIGNIDADGFLSVTDRKKDLIKTSGGKFIAPQPIENSLKHNALIAEALVLGDRRKFPAALILPYFPLLEDWARANNLSVFSREQLITEPRVQALYHGIVADLNRNLAQFEKLKKTVLVTEEFSTANGTLTASMKLRRRAIEERHREQIERMYAEAESSRQRDE